MTKYRHIFLGALLLAFGLPATAATFTISPGTGLQTAIHTASAGDTIQLNPGTYTWAGSPSVATTDTFTINKAVNIVGLGATPAAVVLQGGAGGFGYVVWFSSIAAGNASGASLRNVTLSGTTGGILLQDTSLPRLTDVTIRDVVISASGTNPGVFAKAADRISLDNLTVNSGQGVSWEDVNDSLLMNSTIPSSTVAGASGLRLYTGTRNTFANNTIGTPKSGSGYSFTTTAVSLEHAIGNRLEGNTVQGFGVDGVNIFASNAVNTTKPSDNYIGKNNVIASGFTEVPAKTIGSSMWANCGADNTWFYGNDAQGSPECGVCIWNARSNMALGNRFYNQGISGVYLSGDGDTITDAFCKVPSFRVKPSSTFLQSNEAFFNKNDQLVIRTADKTEISRNYLSPRNGYGGPLQACQSVYCQSAFALEAGTVTPGATSSGFLVVGNTTLENKRGFQTPINTVAGTVSGLDFSLNRVIYPAPPDPATIFSVFISSGLNLDRGANVGGNYWNQHTATGNPSLLNSAPYSSVINTSGGAATGAVIDRFPYRTQDLGRGGNVTVSEPRAGLSIAQGTRRTVRWNAPGCVHVDLLLDGSTSLASNIGNTGYRVVTIPSNTATGSHSITVRCKDSVGTVLGNAASPTFTVTSSDLQLRAPGRDDVFDAGSSIWVAWKKASAVGAVTIKLSTDGGATFPTTLGTSATGTSARVTLPGTAANAYAVIRVEAGSDMDTTDGVFAIRGSGAGFTSASVPSGRTFSMGSLERLEWTSPPGSRVVDITASVGVGGPVVVASNLPDRGSYDWNVPDLGAGSVAIGLAFKASDATSSLGTASSTAGPVTRYTTMLAFGATNSLSIGGTQTISVTSNSGQIPVLSASPPNVCTLAGTLVTGVASGTCTVTASTTGDATYAPGLATASFSVSTNPPRLVNISTRGKVLTGNSFLIGGFAITGSAKKVLVVARGPTVIAGDIQPFERLANPRVTLVGSNLPGGVPYISNDNWQDNSNAADITATGKAPSNTLESAILIDLQPGSYTAIVDSGTVGATGIGIVEVYEIDTPDAPLVNISTRGPVQTGNSFLIGGFAVAGDTTKRVLVVARGPTVIAGDIQPFERLANPRVTLVGSNLPGGVPYISNDNWQDNSNAADITATGKAPSNTLESAILIDLQPGNYTAIVDSGTVGATGIGIIEVYAQ